jgi:hypothetical protein
MKEMDPKDWSQESVETYQRQIYGHNCMGLTRSCDEENRCLGS